GQLDNLYQGFSLRPHTIVPADDLYLAAMHHADNVLPTWMSELIGTYVAILTGCDYASAHHGHNYSYLINDSEKSEKVLAALKSNDLACCGDDREVAALRYVLQLCMEPASIEKQHVDTLSELGWSDGEILEIVQLVAMFSYFVRVINGVGIQLGNEKLGLY
ncbi:MAG: putative peroxidase-related enzyme, partial [Gammaproteobacteria bacterium]